MELRGVAFAASVPEQLWPELELWAKRACLRTVARKPVLYSLRDAFGSAAEIASCIRKSFGRRGADLGSLPADAALWIRVLDSAAFEALASETAPQTEARAPAEAPVAHEAPAQSPLAIATASAPLALPLVAAAVGSEAATSVAAGMLKPQRCPNTPPETWMDVDAFAAVPRFSAKVSSAVAGAEGQSSVRGGGEASAQRGGASASRSSCLVRLHDDASGARGGAAGMLSDAATPHLRGRKVHAALVAVRCRVSCCRDRGAVLWGRDRHAPQLCARLLRLYLRVMPAQEPFEFLLLVEEDQPARPLSGEGHTAARQPGAKQPALHLAGAWRFALRAEIEQAPVHEDGAPRAMLRHPCLHPGALLHRERWEFRQERSARCRSHAFFYL